MGLGVLRAVPSGDDLVPLLRSPPTTLAAGWYASRTYITNRSRAIGQTEEPPACRLRVALL